MGQPAQQQDVPGIQSEMTPRPDCGEDSYQGTGQLTGKVAVITGADSGIGRAVAIAYAREGADVLISYLSEDSDAEEVKGYVEKAGRKARLVRGDISRPQHCRDLIDTAVKELGGVDILVNNAAYQMTYESLDEIPDEDWDRTFDTNIGAFFHLAKAAVPHMKPGSSIIGSSSVNSDMPSPTLAPYAATKAAIANFCASLAQLLGEKGIRVNSVAPGPIWTPLIPATMPPEKVEKFGTDTPLGRAGQPAELAPVYVLLASDAGSYISGARIAVTGGRPILLLRGDAAAAADAGHRPRARGRSALGKTGVCPGTAAKGGTWRFLRRWMRSSSVQVPTGWLRRTASPMPAGRRSCWRLNQTWAAPSAVIANCTRTSCRTPSAPSIRWPPLRR
jgi:NAD(P)-dependent dehydrogenase (short-subunit alcohol dehydrogenase family)